MNTFVFSLLMGAPAGGAEGASGGLGSVMNFVPFIAIIAIFYFLIIRPQNKKQKDTQRMLSALRKGDRVVTIGGIHGTIQSVRDSSVILRVDDSTKIEFSRSAIASVSSQAREDEDEKKQEALPEASQDSGTTRN
ncbi:MAG: preprotein translocase subunit YajC [Treponema sp.]|jgi:preprotein translocase subunit YajC|nr:preprotein translocase subunit YajC [Treponema sp.]